MNRAIGLITTNYATEGLGVLTEDRTIASMPYGGRYRMIDFPLSNMVNSGITTVGVITPYKYRSLLDHIGAGKEWSLDRKTGGLFILPGSVYGISSSAEERFILRDLKRAMVFFLRSPAQYVLVSAANTISNVDCRKFMYAHIESGADITMAYKVAKGSDPHMTKLITDGDRIKGISRGVEAEDEVFLDCFIIKRELLLKAIKWYEPLDYIDFFEAIKGDFDKMDVYKYHFDTYSRSIFTTQEYYQYSMELLNAEIGDVLFNLERPILTKATDRAPAIYGKHANVKKSYITGGGTIDGNVENSILFRGVKVKSGATVKNSIIMQSCEIGEGACVENAIIDRNNIIVAGSVMKGTPDSVLVMGKNFTIN